MNPEALAARYYDMHRFVSHLQVLAGTFAELPAGQLLERWERFADAIPQPPSRAEQLVVGELLRQALMRLHRATRREPATAWEPGQLNAHAFREAVRKLREASSVREPPRLVEFRRILSYRYNEPGLSATRIATDMDISLTHLVRVLTRHTGHGFPWHLHKIRMNRAQELLSGSINSVKQISSSVGYVHPSQFDRHFRKEFGLRPSEYRLQHRVARTRTGLEAAS